MSAQKPVHGLSLTDPRCAGVLDALPGMLPVSPRNVTSYSELRRAEKECDPGEMVLTNVGFLLALRKGSDSRDDFAKAAVKGICAHPDTWGLGVKQIAESSYEVADAMLKAREA